MRKVVVLVIVVEVLDEREVEISLSKSETTQESEKSFGRDESFVQGLVDGAIETSRSETGEVEGLGVKERRVGRSKIGKDFGSWQIC